MTVWKIYVLFRNGDTITKYFDNYDDARKTFVNYFTYNVIKATLETA